MPSNTLLKVLEQLLHKIKANRRREMVSNGRTMLINLELGLEKAREHTVFVLFGFESLDPSGTKNR